jgi:hypothetical protein
MADYKRINGDYNIQTLNAGDEIRLTTSNVEINGNLAVSGNISASIVTAAFFIGERSIPYQCQRGQHCSIGQQPIQWHLATSTYRWPVATSRLV